MSKTQSIINEAKKLLESNPLDAGHDLSHHERVTVLALEIAKMINNSKEINHVIKVAAMWHDVQAPGSEDLISYLQSRLDNHGFEDEFKSKVIECIQTHSMDQNPTLTEAQILFDADKLDALNLDRARNIANAIMQKKISEKRKNFYIHVGTSWIKNMKTKLHFNFSKKIFDKSVKEILKSKEVEEIAEKINIDLTEVKNSLKRNLSLKDRIMLFISKLALKFRK